MNWFDRYVVAPFAPRAALRMMAARRAIRAYQEAGEPSRYRKTRTDKASANVNNKRSAEKIKTQARHLDENFDIASGILDVLVANTVGSGIWPEPQIMLKDGTPATEINSLLLKLYEDFRFRPEVTWQHDIAGSQRLVARSYFRDGEAFGKHLVGDIAGLDHGTIVPYSVELLESDYLPYDLNSDKPQVIQGIEVSDWMRPVAYHFYKRHPGELGGGRLFGLSNDTKRWKAEDVFHVAFRKRLHQLRGMSAFAAITNRLDDIKDIDECERVAAKVAASMAGYIRKGQPDMYEGPSGDETESGRRSMQFEAGLIFDDLEPGEEIGTIDTKRPNNELIPFRDSQLKAAAAGVPGASYSSISKNYDGSYSSKRQELVESYQTYQVAVGPLVCGMCQPMWERFVDASLMSGRVVLTSDVDRETLWDCTHTGPSMPWIDPKKEMEAFILAMQWNLTSRSRVIRKSGNNPDQINREIVRDRAEAEKLGIDISGPDNSAAPPDERRNTDDE